jgi:hypothetical protein
MKVAACTALVFLVGQCAIAQWSTSTNAFNSLFVTPGFSQSIITFDDGSSIICGGLADSRYAQKLDPFGYKMWPQPVEIVNNPGTSTTTINGPIDDGDGGLILWWPDDRGAEFGEFGPFNNALYMQRVDKNGTIRWQVGGVQIDSVTGGMKNALAVSDGVGGIILYGWESDFLRSGATKTEHTWIERFDGNGNRIWELTLDSTKVQYGLVPRQPIRFGSRLYFTTMNGPRFLDPLTGAPQTPPTFIPHGGLVVDGFAAAFDIGRKADRFDSLGRKYREYSATCLNSNWDPVWATPFEIRDLGYVNNFIPMNNNVLPDKVGGLFYCEPSSNDSSKKGVRLRRITRDGSQFNNDEVQIILDSARNGFGFNGRGEFGVYFTVGKAFKFDTTGRSMWPQNFTVISDPDDAYTQEAASDNNGGAITVYWTTLGGIYAQHTGRTGKVGAITSVRSQTREPLGYALEQNYPNPFNPSTRIRFSMPGRSHVSISVFNTLGQEVAKLVNGYQDPGYHDVPFDARGLASGVYFYRLEAGSFIETKKLVLLH